ncbi:MAG: flagellar filament capping protein FliD [Acidobacteriaceae bacterium]|jgi:flagellar hook-associated protein 2
MSTSAITPSTSSINISNILAATVGANTPGIDVNSAVAAALYADRAPERGWQADQTTLSSETTALTAIQTATQAVQTDMQNLNSLTGPLSARSAASSDPGIVSASAAAGTPAGNHTIVVNSLATTGSWYSDPTSSPTATLPASSFTLTTTAGASVTIPTGTGAAANNLNDLASTINGDSLSVTASVVSDATGSRLAIVSNASGAAGDFSITSANYTGTSWTSPDIPTGDTLGANSFTLTSGGTTTTIATTSGESYATVASDINAMNLGVTATAGSDANGTNLSIVSTNGTTPFTISEPSFGFTQSAAGANASLTVDGVPITSASNTVTGAISGVTLSLTGADPGVPVSLGVTSNASQISTAINQFVTDYNTAIGLVNAQFTIASGSTSEGVLASDPTVVSLQSTLEGALNYAATPAAGTTTTVSTLNDLGITQNTDGTLAVDTATLDNAITNNPTDVQNFLEGTALNGFANSMNNALTGFTEPANGAFTLDLSGISATNANLTSQINDFETNYIASQQTILTAEYSSAEIALQQLPMQMAQINAELGLTPTGNSSGG